MKKKRSSRLALAENFNELTKSDGGVDALRKLLGVGNSTIQRLKEGNTVQLDTLETVADHYKLEVHRLLLPKLGAAAMSFDDLNALEAQLITYFRAIKDQQRRLSLVSRANKLAADAANDSDLMGLIETESYNGPDRRKQQ